MLVLTINKQDLMKLKHFCAEKDRITQVKSNAIMRKKRENTYQLFNKDSGLIHRIRTQINNHQEN